MKLSPVVDLHINAFNGPVITDMDSGMTNAVAQTRGQGTYITQRPNIDIFDDASVNTALAKGRAVYYWETGAAVYTLNDTTIFKTDSSNAISTGVTTGTKKAKFVEMGTFLVLINSESDEAFTITSGDTVTEITDTDFPPKQTPAVPLAYGGVVLDNVLYVLGTNGIVYGSEAVVDTGPTNWGALDFLEAGRDPDSGVAIGKHHDNAVIYGTNTIEFMYNAGNTAGLSLSRRQDISYNIGMQSGETLWEEGDRAFFIGRNFSGSLGVYTLENFQIRKISTPTIDSMLSDSLGKQSYLAVGSGVSAQGHIFYTLTLYHVSTTIVPDITLVFDDTAGLWGEWTTSVGGLTKFPLVDFTKRLGVTSRYGEGVMSNGDMVTIDDTLVPGDSLLAAGWVETAWVETGWVSRAASSSTVIPVKSRLGQSDFGSTLEKYPLTYKLAADLTPNSQTLTLNWADENNTTFSSGKTFDTSLYQKSYRNGRFRRRNHEINYSGTDVLRLEAIEADIPTGDN